MKRGPGFAVERDASGQAVRAYLWPARQDKSAEKSPTRRRYGKCADCGHKFQAHFENQRRCHPCAAERKRADRARVQPDLPLEGDARGD